MTTTIGNVPPATTGITVTARHKAFFLGLPKVELHCHLLGTVRQKTFEALLDKHRAPLSREDVAGFYRRDGKPIGVLRVLLMCVWTPLRPGRPLRPPIPPAIVS